MPSYPSIAKAATLLLQKEFIEARSVGQDSQSIASLFIDISAEQQAKQEDNEEPWAEPGRRRFKVLSQLLSSNVDPSNLVIIGGPGQGKTTLVQMYEQFNRAALLRSLKAGSYHRWHRESWISSSRVPNA